MSKKYIDIDDLEEWEDADDLEAEFKENRRKSHNRKMTSQDPAMRSDFTSEKPHKKLKNDKEN